MLDDASRGFLGISFAELIVTVVCLAAFLIPAWASIRALNSLSTLIREKRPERWANVLLGYDLWIAQIILGTNRLDITDGDYRAALWTARKRMMLSGILFAAILAMIWFSARA